ncbi:MAG: site-2 protease family protein [Clostridia bacterium]|nr:site-2 protease family protein [Clostridia bacterium]
MSITRGQFSIVDILLTLPGVLVAITFHEFSHAFAADKLGDDTPRMQGRLNLNPLSHIDPFGIFMLVFAHIGWGKPVQINPRNFNSKFSASTCEAIVAFAGPLMNFILSIVFTVIFYAVTTFASAGFLHSTVGEVIVTMLSYTVIVNVGLGVFNLIPLPPLDGSKILKRFLPYNARVWMEANEYVFYIIFLIIWITDIASLIITPIINAIISGLSWAIGGLFGMFM